MSNEKRIVVFFILMFVWMMSYPYIVPPVLRVFGIETAPAKRPALAAAKDALDKAKNGKADLPKIAAGAPALEDAKQGSPKQPAVAPEKQGEIAAVTPAQKPSVELVDESELVLGSVKGQSSKGYRLQVQLEQKGAGVESVSSSQYDAEFEDGMPRKRPLQFLRRDPLAPPSLSLTLSQGAEARKDAPPADDAQEAEDKIPKEVIAEAEDLLDSVLWEVVRDEQGRVVRPISGSGRVTKGPVDGQAVVFRTKAANGVILTKTFRLWQNTDGLEVELKFESPDKERSIVYNLQGPHGIPIEGEWYTGTFRDLVFGKLNQSPPETMSAYDVASSAKLIENTTLPLHYAGIENQYFATLIAPSPAPTGQDDRWDSKTTALVLHKDPNALQKADIGVKITSRPVHLGPNQNAEHTYLVFAGPKTEDALKPYDASDLATYRKNQWIPFAPWIARYVITPTLGFTYEVTARVAHLFGGKQGNYGIAIILLTVLVRALMFPLGRKQALAAQKMQELQPHLKSIQEKHKDDKEKLTQETFALYKKHGVNPVSGCLPALVQLPIFVGLWQALNSSVALRHAPFLWIRDLAAPDMLFRFPLDVPFLGKWFNLLPFVVVALMLVQTKLFSPPATTPEAEMQQKTMKYMMIFMGVMFYKVPSGLGLYFITSSLWAVGERLLLPKVTHARPAVQPASAGAAGDGPRGAARGGLNGDGAGGAKGTSEADGSKVKLPGKLSQFWERLLDEARKDSTYRKMVEDREEKGRDKGKPRAKPRKR
jgi:YidC/Oxa1 family membrane protein insertase